MGHTESNSKNVDNRKNQQYVVLTLTDGKLHSLKLVKCKIIERLEVGGTVTTLDSLIPKHNVLEFRQFLSELKNHLKENNSIVS